MSRRTATRAGYRLARPRAWRPAFAVLAFAALMTCDRVLAPAAAADAAAELAQRYAPVVRLVAQAAPCGHGEPYQPTDVDVVLGNRDVALRGPWDTTNVVEVAPTARDLSKGLFGYHLDFAGNALSPGCTYDEWSHRITAGSRPTVYARLAGEPGYPGLLALQYWFFYVYNDFNNKHEGDWEMIQLDFSARSAAEALTRSPSEVGYSQHDGAERAAWGESKLELVDGTHPVVYPALGSHANYYASKLYLGRSAAQGVGCDDTVGPSRELRPVVALIPSQPAAYVRRFPWLGYAGHWGEQHRAIFDGPTGPNTNQKWKAPITWARTSWRGTSFAVPAGRSVGPSATDFFCGAVGAGSTLLTALVGNPSAVLLVLAVASAFVMWLASRTRWDQSAPFRARRRRPWGSLVASAVRLYGRNLRLFLGIGLLFVPLGLVVTAVQYAIFEVGTLRPLVASAGQSNAVVGTLALGLGVFVTILGLSVVQAATSVAVSELDAGRAVAPRAAYAAVLGKLRPLLAGVIVAAVVVALLGLTGLGLVFGIWLAIRWSLLAQAVMLDERADARPLRRSAVLVRGHWWRVASITLFVAGLGLLLGPLVGTLLLFVTSASFDFVNLVSAVVYVFALPLVAITTTYLYFDLAVRRQLSARESPETGVLPAEP